MNPMVIPWVIGIVISCFILGLIILFSMMFAKDFKKKKKKREKDQEETTKTIFLQHQKIVGLCKKWNETGGKLVGKDLDLFNNLVKEGNIIIEKVDNKLTAKPIKIK